jgi:TetR/AcrR family transcriptional regulator, transcriptional repressor for nem operon
VASHKLVIRQGLISAGDYHTVGSMDTREKILNSAQRLIQTRSFHGFSFQDIADEVGIRKASLYHYFESKDALALAVLERAGNWVNAQMQKAEGEEPRDRLEAYFDMFGILHGKGERMCPGGSFASVFDAVSSPVKAALHRFTKLHLDWLENIVREGVARGQFEIGDQRPRDVAMQIVANVQGALLTGRLTGDPHVLDSVASELRTYLSCKARERTSAAEAIG